MKHSWAVSGPLLGIWGVIAVVAFVLKAKLFVKLIPVVGIIFITYLFICTMSSFKDYFADQREARKQKQSGKQFTSEKRS